jgi:transcriptional regulator with XRE-family HTH domain
VRPGEQLKAIRVRLGITTREVEEQSRKIAEHEANEDYILSNAWLTQIENKDSIPSIYKLYSLATIFRMKFTELLTLFGIDLDKIAKYQMDSTLETTHLTMLDVSDENRRVTFPVRFDRGFSVDTTNLLSRMVEVWGEMPIALIQHLNIRESQYGYIGLKDFTLHPMLRPGSFVQIDQRVNKIQAFPWRTEYERPIYFVELRGSYACAWCELQGNQLTLIPHPLSPCRLRHFVFGREAEIVGRVTAVAMRIVDPAESAHGKSAGLSERL